MKISIHDKSSLDNFAQRVAPQTSMSKSRLKTAIAKAYSFAHITALESALSVSFNPSEHVYSVIDDVQPLTVAESTVLAHVSEWLQDNIDLGDSDVEFGEFSSEHVDGMVRRLLRQAQSNLEISDVDRDILSEFSDWLSDNAALDICFDNDNKVHMHHVNDVVCAILRRTVRKSATTIALLKKQNVADECLAHFEVESEDEFDSEHYEQAEDAVVESAKNIVNNPDLSSAIAALQRAGLINVAEQLAALNATVLRCNYLSEHA